MNAAAHPPPELHLPDLPEVSVSLGPLRPTTATGLPSTLAQRLREGLSNYLPLLLMALLAGGTWWLVKNTPQNDGAAPEKVLRHEPDYSMRGFTLTRFAPDGRLTVRVEGDVLRHFPDTDRLEIDGARFHAGAPDGRITRAHAKQAVANGDVTEVQLIGAAHVQADLGAGGQLLLDSEFLHAFVRFERLRTHLPVVVKRNGHVTTAAGLDYDHLNQQLRLDGPLRSVLPPGGQRAAKVVP